MNKEGLYRSITKSLDLQDQLREEDLSQREREIYFAMRCNGFFLSNNREEWKFDHKAVAPLEEEFQGQKISFFGPNAGDGFFFSSGNETPPSALQYVFSQPEVTALVRKYREVNEDQAARISFILGGVARYINNILWPKTHPGSYSYDQIAEAVKFVAGMGMLGEKRSGDAIVSAIAMCTISRGSLEEDRNFRGNVYRMSEAIKDDPVVPIKTKDLGLSQVARLRAFLDCQPLPYIKEFDIGAEEMTFDRFPTIGAEFHFPSDAPQQYPDFWQRLAILNMSQYQRGSYIQLSRNDQGVIEVRMNPSLYPITIANWEYMRRILPELNKAFFSITINRPQGDFIWANKEDETLLNNLRAIGLLVFAGMFENSPRMGVQGEINLGSVYLGQTVRLNGEKYAFTGTWWGKEGQYGQLSIYAGFGSNFPHLAYYLSMALANPDIMRFDGFLSGIKNLNDALAVRTATGKDIFRTLQNRIQTDERLSRAHTAGRRIIDLLSP